MADAISTFGVPCSDGAVRIEATQKDLARLAEKSAGTIAKYVRQLKADGWVVSTNPLVFAPAGRPATATAQTGPDRTSQDAPGLYETAWDVAAEVAARAAQDPAHPDAPFLLDVAARLSRALNAPLAALDALPPRPEQDQDLDQTEISRSSVSSSSETTRPTQGAPEVAREGAEGRAGPHGPELRARWHQEIDAIYARHDHLRPYTNLSRLWPLLDEHPAWRVDHALRALAADAANPSKTLKSPVGALIVAAGNQPGDEQRDHYFPGEPPSAQEPLVTAPRSDVLFEDVEEDGIRKVRVIAPS